VVTLLRRKTDRKQLHKVFGYDKAPGVSEEHGGRPHERRYQTRLRLKLKDLHHVVTVLLRLASQSH
jgi:hypothetical protein